MSLDSFYCNFSLAAVNCSPFVGRLRDPSHAKMSFLYSAGRHIECRRTDKISERVCAIGELLAPQLRPQRTLGEDIAEKKFVRVIRALVQSEKLKNLTCLDSWKDESENGILKNRRFKGEKFAFWPETIPAKNCFYDDKGNDLLDKHLAMDILTLFTIRGKNLKNEIIYCLLGMHGLINEGICQISKDAFQNFGINLDYKFLEKFCKSVHQEYKNDLTPDVVREINSFWDSWIPPSMQQMRPPLQNNSLNLIKNSFLSFPDFPWEKLSQEDNVYKELEDFSKLLSGDVSRNKFETLSKISRVLLGKKQNRELPEKVAIVIKEYHEGKNADIETPENVKNVLKNIRRFSGIDSPHENVFKIEDINKRIERIKVGCDSKNKWFSIRY